MSRRIAIIGAGVLGRTLLAHIADFSDLRAIGFFDDSITSNVDGLPTLGRLDAISSRYAAGDFDAVVMGIGYNHLQFRASLFASLGEASVPFATLIHPSAYVHATASIGSGAVLFPRCIVDAKSSVGSNSLLNTGCIIAHDTSVGDGCFLGPGVTIAGFVTTGSNCFIGTGTVIKDNITLSQGARTGAGAVVVSDVAAHTLVVGVPARPVTTR
ncbi:acetyltransferase [Tardiphaga sp. 841_E9_N1_2]|jgi:acetyltransferase EpsM|uniref:acetyltransferase n=1 Tax=Tardiphaga sp. 841_E9_N1_2 TaxID=3240762 RepID=UPI003F1FF0DC